MSREAVIGIMNEYRWDVEDICNDLIEMRDDYDKLSLEDDKKFDKINELARHIEELESKIDDLESELEGLR